MTRIKIKITKEILKESSDCNINGKKAGDNCAIALAVRDIFPKAWITPVSILAEGLNFKRRESCFVIPLPEEAVNFIRMFDNNSPEGRQEMNEREFELEIPDEALQLIGNGEIEQVKQIISQSKTLELCQ